MSNMNTLWHAPGLGEVHDSTGRVIAMCVDVDPVEEEQRPSPSLAEGEQLARLIAAAPDHHAVALELDRLMLVIESAVRWQDPTNHAAVLAMLKANRAAIAKATQEPPHA